MRAVFVMLNSLNRNVLGPYGGTKVPPPTSTVSPRAPSPSINTTSARRPEAGRERPADHARRRPGARRAGACLLDRRRARLLGPLRPVDGHRPALGRRRPDRLAAGRRLPRAGTSRRRKRERPRLQSRLLRLPSDLRHGPFRPAARRPSTAWTRACPTPRPASPLMARTRTRPSRSSTRRARSSKPPMAATRSACAGGSRRRSAGGCCASATPSENISCSRPAQRDALSLQSRLAGGARRRDPVAGRRGPRRTDRRPGTGDRGRRGPWPCAASEARVVVAEPDDGAPRVEFGFATETLTHLQLWRDLRANIGVFSVEPRTSGLETNGA